MEACSVVSKISNISTLVNQLIGKANELVTPDLQRFGGYLTILDKENGKVLMILACGIIPEDKQAKYLKLSMEKAYRLFENKDHKTSWESKNEVNLKFPGAVKGFEAIYSFSGHQPDVDEAISISIFYLLEPSDKKKIKEKADLFNYYYYEVSLRNIFIKQFLSFAKLFYGNIWLDVLFNRK